MQNFQYKLYQNLTNCQLDIKIFDTDNIKNK